MQVALTLLFWLSASRPAAAHGPELVGPDTLWGSWSVEPFSLLAVAIAIAVYLRGQNRLRFRGGRGPVSRTTVLSFLASALALFVALVSPLDALGGTLLSAHMAQHGLLVTIAPPLFLLGKPGIVFAWALPAAARRALLSSALWRSLTLLGHTLSRPLPAATLHGLALWIWHAPAAFEAAIASDAMHAFEHASFFGTAILFWRALLNARSSSGTARALGAAFATLAHSGLLGALITMAPAPLYGFYELRSTVWGLSALEDQQLAGLLMWVPMGFVYLAACIVLANRLLQPRSPRPPAVLGYGRPRRDSTMAFRSRSRCGELRWTNSRDVRSSGGPAQSPPQSLHPHVSVPRKTPSRVPRAMRS